MPRYRVSCAVVGSKYLGEFEASSFEEAIEKALSSHGAYVSFCHQCSGECEDPEIDEDSVVAEIVEDCATPKELMDHQEAVVIANLRNVMHISKGLSVRDARKAIQRLNRAGEVVYDRKKKAWKLANKKYGRRMGAGK